MITPSLCLWHRQAAHVPGHQQQQLCFYGREVFQGILANKQQKMQCSFVLMAVQTWDTKGQEYMTRCTAGFDCSDLRFKRFSFQPASLWISLNSIWHHNQLTFPPSSLLKAHPAPVFSPGCRAMTLACGLAFTAESALANTGAVSSIRIDRCKSLCPNVVCGFQ